MPSSLWDTIEGFFNPFRGERSGSPVETFLKYNVPVDERAKVLAQTVGVVLANQVKATNSTLSEERILEAVDEFKDNLHFAGFEEPQLQRPGSTTEETFSLNDLEKYGKTFEKSLREHLKSKNF